MSVPPEIISAWMAALGMPPGSRWIQIATRGPIRKGRPATILETLEATGPGQIELPTSELKRWAGFSFDLFGRVMDRIAPEAPNLSFGLEGEGDQTIPFNVQPWRQLAWVPDSPVSAASLWTPASGVQNYLRFDDVEFSDDELKQAGHALQLITKLDELRGHGGKQRGDGKRYPDKDQFIRELTAAVADAQAATGKARPGAPAVWVRMGLGRSAFHAYVKEHTKKRWQDVESSYAELNGFLRPHDGR